MPCQSNHARADPFVVVRYVTLGKPGVRKNLPVGIADPDSTDNGLLWFAFWHFDPHLSRAFIVSQPQKTAMPDITIAGELGEFHLCYQIRPDPDRLAHDIRWHIFYRGRFARRHCLGHRRNVVL